MLNPEYLAKGCEQFEFYVDFMKKERCHYDFRDYDGVLFSCVKNTYKDCVKAKDNWLKGKNNEKK